MTTPAQAQVARLSNALPFWLSMALAPLPWIGALHGGWALALAPVCTWYMVSLLDAITGLDKENADPQTGEDQLFWHRLVVILWAPVQFGLIVSLLAYVPDAAHLTGWEKVGVFFGMGVISGTVGIVYAHELLHQRKRLERWLGDLLLAMVLYSHFRSEHLLVHHRYVGTGRDPVTARYNEGFHRYYPRVLLQCPPSAFRAERAMLARKGLAWWHLSNPFWLYAALQGGALLLALVIGGRIGLGLFLVQAGTAIWALELTNYVEHYGLTRKHLGEGKYEHVQPRHSWNASHRASNWLLINLQRHSDHHYKPDRRFPLLQTYAETEAPQLPYGYPVMAMLAMVPPLWRRVMNPRVRAWRRTFYPEIKDWGPYKTFSLPPPR
jgi:alkane 1-monooxygenase